MTLSHAVGHASPAMVSSALATLTTTSFPRGEWLPPNNRYASDTVKQIDRDLAANSLHVGDLSEYVAASVILHCFDGWSFLSQAIDCLLDRDSAAAVHLAYYAELRAALSFLASQGIAIFNYKHFWFDATGTCTPLLRAGGTHEVVWRALKEWAAQSHNGPRILEVLRIQGRSFREWIDAAQRATAGPTISALASEWLQSWSLDLQMLGSDHELRNDASYRPQQIRSPLSAAITVPTLKQLVNFWKACEPASAGSLEQLDMQLLGQALGFVYQRRTGRGVNSKGYRETVTTMFADLGITNHLMRTVLSTGSSAKSPILKAAATPFPAPGGTIDPLTVIARSFLLLRLASAFANDLLRSNGISAATLVFWWKSMGLNLGLWGRDDPPAQVIDLWADIDDALGNIEMWLATTANRRAWQSTRQARHDLSFELWQLKQFQRAGLWALGL